MDFITRTDKMTRLPRVLLFASLLQRVGLYLYTVDMPVLLHLTARIYTCIYAQVYIHVELGKPSSGCTHTRRLNCIAFSRCALPCMARVRDSVIRN